MGNSKRSAHSSHKYDVQNYVLYTKSKVFETLDPSSSSSSGVAVVEPNARLGAVVRKREGMVALATPTERRRRDGLEKQSNR